MFFLMYSTLSALLLKSIIKIDLTTSEGRMEREIDSKSAAEMSFLRRMSGHSLRDRVRSSAIRRSSELSVPGTSNQKEAQGTAQDTLEGLCLSAGLGTTWASPGGAGGGV
ncbi:hypothetical protein AMECASPLE_038603 [Ameca splendens]|uniref:Uncharacterized protein n=1 Tax=Ameca splendens TaxID=208324 RepID=A0ABV0Z8C1_9TELE